MTDLTDDSFDYVLFHDEALSPSNGDPLGNLSIVHVPTNCACNRDITFVELRAVAHPLIPSSRIHQFVEPINTAFNTYGIKNCLQKSHALAQIFHESTDLKDTAEGVNAAVEQSNYGGYKGRGLIQLTGHDNYESYGSYKGQSFLGANRVFVEQPNYAADSAGWFWSMGNSSQVNLNDLADKNDIIAITIIINGGLNGFKERKRRLLKFFEVFHVATCLELSKAVYSDIENVNTLTSFSQSWIYAGNNKIKKGGCFAWGYWQDPEHPHTNHMAVSQPDSKEGYIRYLQVTASAPLLSARYGLGTVSHMNQIANAGSQ